MVTVLMAVYQGERYLEQQLDSILAQTVPVRIRISDDGSDDRSREILENYRAWYPGQIILDHRERLSGSDIMRVPAPAQNFFWLMERERETGESDYIMLSDQDDVWCNDKVRRQLARMRRLESETAKECPILLHSDMEVIDAYGEEIHPSFFQYQGCSPARTSLAEVLVENPVTGGAVMMNRSLLSLAGKIPEACCMHDWWLALAASAFGIIDWVERPLSQYRQHEGNALGARQAGGLGRLRLLAERPGRNAEVRGSYLRMFNQALAFGKRYGEYLESDQKEILRAFLELPGQNPAQRLRSIARHGFMKNSRLQTMAMCVTIPERKQQAGRGTGQDGCGMNSTREEHAPAGTGKEAMEETGRS
ncbi:MAG: glycosyltransferase family 2 protein [Clostridiales bacterium]|nr:glycosyltransferase family 2 protein [Clostridiales bacterium]